MNITQIRNSIKKKLNAVHMTNDEWCEVHHIHPSILNKALDNTAKVRFTQLLKIMDALNLQLLAVDKDDTVYSEKELELRVTSGVLRKKIQA